MDRITKIKKHLKREQWNSLIKECQTSGMTVASWCKQHDICQQTYYRNLKKIREELCDSIPPPIQKTQRLVPFTELELHSSAPSVQSAMVLQLPTASREIHNGANQDTVEAVLFALKNLC